MPVILPEGFGVFALKWSAEGDPEEMVITGGYYSPSGLATDVETHANKIGGEWLDAFPVSSFSSRYIFVGVDVTFNPTDGGLGQASFVSNVTGTGTASPLPTNTAFLVRKTSVLLGRKHKGRFYVPPFVLPEANVDSNGMMTAADTAGVQTRFTAFYDGLVAAPAPVIQPYILHDDNSTPTLVTSFQLQRQVATQRRRMRP